MRVPWGLIVVVILGLGALIAFDRYSGRTDRWEQRLDSAVVATKQAVRADSAALAAKLAASEARTDSAQAKADEEAARRIGIAQELGRTRVALANARGRNDTSAIITEQAAVIVQQDSVIASDSAQKVALRRTIAGKDETILDLREGLRVANGRIADLLSVADRRPKEFTLFGLTLGLHPYLGAGLNVSPAGQAAIGLQLGLSILRGK